MRILLSNDDGHGAPGLEVLTSIAQELSDDIWIVVPSEEQSGQARAMTFSAPLRLKQCGPKEFTTSGTPADTMLLALDVVMKDNPPDLVLTGVNAGQNIGADTTNSGTIGGAMVAMERGIAAIALSQARGFMGLDSIAWPIAGSYAPKIIRQLLDVGWPENVVMNINFPDCEMKDVAGIEVTRQGIRDEAIVHVETRRDLRGNDYYWLGYEGKLSKPSKGTDLLAIYENRISVTPLQLDITDDEALDSLREAKFEL